jgi:hypothetical protein
MRKVKVRFLKPVRLLGRKVRPQQTAEVPLVLAHELLDTGVAVLAETREPVITQQPGRFSIMY